MRFVIRKVPERNTDYLERLIPNAIVYNDIEHVGALFSFLSVLKYVNGDACYVQDDMILCKDFRKRAMEYINRMPHDVIVFSNFTIDKTARDVVKEGFYDAMKGGWLLCTYIPKEIADGFLEWWREGEYKKDGRFQKWIKNQYDDAFFCKYLQSVGKEVYVVVPNLAGHPKNKSVIDNRRPKVTTNFDFENCEKDE